MKTINKSINSLDKDTFERLCKEVCNTYQAGGKIIATGLGKNAPICEKFEGTLLSFGLPARFLHTNTAIHGDLGVVSKGDLVLILSKSGETPESIYLLKELKKRQVAIWILTFNPESTLAKSAENSLIIKMDNEGDAWNIVPNNSTTVYLIVLQAIAILTAEKLGITLDDFRKNHPGGGIGVRLNETK